MNWSDVVANIRTDGWRGLAGSRMELRLPVRQPLIDYLLHGMTWPKAVQRAQVTLQDDNHLTARIAISFFGMHREVELKLRLAPSLEERRLTLFIENQALIAAALAIVGPALTLPPGVSIEAARIVVNVDELAASRHAADVAAQLASATFEGREATLWVGAVIDVHAVDPAAAAGGGSSVQSSASLPPAEEAVHLLRDASASWSLRVTEPLANQLLEAAVGSVRGQPAAPGDRDELRPLLESLRSLEVHFEDGVVVLTGSATLA